MFPTRAKGQPPLSLPGLAMAGANKALHHSSGPIAGEDGILYAPEVANLKLDGTVLATLSACGTGGEGKGTAAGFYEMVDALHAAGAKNVVISLWHTDSPLSAEFMGEFYRRWFDAGAGSDPATALRETQLAWIRSDDPMRREPLYWAAYALFSQR